MIEKEQKEFKKIRDEAIEGIKIMRKKNLRDADMHDAIFVHWIPYHEKEKKKALKLAEERHNKLWGKYYGHDEVSLQKEISQLKAENLELLREIAIGKKEAEKR